ncbi:MAG: O-acetyl-ADP-ribose deacetylase [Gudongella sp.]|nr:O-acetyl-ADP-ribose deacetylase [Gudongella sp.]
MPLEIIRNDITKVKADAIVNAARNSLLGGGGVDGAIHKAAGPELLNECKKLNGCETGQAKITKAYNLPVKYVIHTVGPVWKDGNHNEIKLLEDCYRNSLELAKAYNMESVAFPLISAGAFGFPQDKALRTAISVIGDFLLKNEMTIYLVIYNDSAYKLSAKLFSSIKQYIDDKYVEEHRSSSSERREQEGLLEEYNFQIKVMESMNAPTQKKRKRKLNDVINQLDETFSQMLLRLIDEKKLTDAETYKKANIDRKLFSKIRNDISYRPSKSTVLAFAIALELNLDQTQDLLLRAGFALSNSSKFDVIIQYFLEEENYNIFEINEALFAFDENLLGV